MKLCRSFLKFTGIVIQLKSGFSWSYITIVPFPILMILLPFLKNNAELFGENEKHFAKEVIWSEGLEVHRMIPFPGLNIWLEVFRKYKKHWKKKFFIPSVESGVDNSISCLDYSISYCTFQNNKDLLTMVCFGGK